MSDSIPKSAYELAMERLRKKDAEEGVSIRPLTEPEREAIAEVRRFYEAKLAQEDVRRAHLGIEDDPRGIQ